MRQRIKAGLNLNAEARVKYLLLLQGVGFIAWSLILQKLGLESKVDILRWVVGLSSLGVFGYFVVYRPDIRLKYHLVSAVMTLANITCLFAIYSSGGHPFTLIGGVLVVNVSLIFFKSPRWALGIILLWATCLPWVLFHTKQQLPPHMTLICFSFALMAGYFAFVGQYEGVQQMLKTKELSKSLLSMMTEGVVLHDHDTSVIFINEAASELLKVPHKNFVGTSNFDPQWRSFHLDGTPCPPEQHPSFVARMSRTGVIQFPMRMMKPDGESIYLSINAIPLACPEDQEFPQVLVTFQDITLHELNAKKIIEQEQMLQHAAKLNALAEMASGIAHEINNPLAIINGRVMQLKEMVPENPDAQTVLDKIEKTVWRISDIIRSMRSIVDESRVSSTKVDVTQAIERVVNICQTNLSEKNVKLELEIPKNVFALGNESQVAQVLLNVVQNATDAVEGIESPWIKVEVRESTEAIDIVVKNKGEIAQEVMAKIGQPFFTTKDAGKGKGLGVSVSKSMVKKMNGSLQFGSSNGETYFDIKLPKFAA